MSDRTGDQGPAGVAGVAGRQGEAGPAGRQGEIGDTGETGAHGRTGRTGKSMSRLQVLVLFLFVVAAFAVVSVRTEVQQRQLRAAQAVIARQQEQIAANAKRLEVLAYAQCVDRNVGSARQIKLIDSAIAAEKRKPHPDPKRIKDLEDFKPSLANCGPKP